MNPTTAALVAALADAICFAEDVYGDTNVHLANRVTNSWCKALRAAQTASNAESADLAQSVKFHLDQAVDLAAKGWNHALAVANLTGVDVGDVLNSVQLLADPADNQASNLPADTVATLIANWQLTVRRRRRAKRL